MIAKMHREGARLIIAMCDSDILGKKFEDGNRVLDLSSAFYKGTEVTKEKIRPFLKKAYVINAAGKQSIALLVEEGIIKKDSIRRIDDVPHVQTVNMSL